MGPHTSPRVPSNTTSADSIVVLLAAVTLIALFEAVTSSSSSMSCWKNKEDDTLNILLQTTPTSITLRKDLSRNNTQTQTHIYQPTNTQTPTHARPHTSQGSKTLLHIGDATEKRVTSTGEWNPVACDLRLFDYIRIIVHSHAKWTNIPRAQVRAYINIRVFSLSLFKANQKRHSTLVK